MKPPIIKVEIIHIEGPLKGTIQEFYDSLIEIGRHPDCHVCFPKDMIAISRKHLDIRREGNRFMAIDHSTNGTLVNGKPIEEIILKDGDVLTIGENGPKISVLTTVINEDELPPELRQPLSVPESTPEPVPISEPAVRNRFPEEPVEIAVAAQEIKQPELSKFSGKEEDSASKSVQTVQKSFVIQFGAKIKSYQTLPIILGSGEDCDFSIEHPAILGRHAQIHYHNDSYYIRDLTGRGLITINGRPVNDEAVLVADTCVSLTGKGPSFQFLGDGRLAEIETSTSPANVSEQPGSQISNNQIRAEKKKGIWPFSKK